MCKSICSFISLKSDKADSTLESLPLPGVSWVSKNREASNLGFLVVAVDLVAWASGGLSTSPPPAVMALTLILFQGPGDLWPILNSGKSLPLHSTSKCFFLSPTHHFHWEYLTWLFSEFGLHKTKEMLTLVSGFPDGSIVKNLPASAGDAGSIPGFWRSPGEGNGNSLLGNPMGRGAWWATVHGVTESQILT